MPTDRARWPFEKLLAQVLEDRRPHLAERTIQLEKERSLPLLKCFGKRRVAEISAETIRAWQAKRLKEVSSRTVNLEGRLIRHVLKEAKIWATVADSYKALPEDRRGPGRALEELQERLLFDTARSKPGWDVAFYGAMVAANTTMRSIEIKSLRIGDVNLIEREVSVNRSKGNTSGVRRIPLNDAAVWAFARLLERAQALGAINPEHYLLPRFRYRETKTADRGNGYDPTRPQKTWRSAWRSLVKETGRRAAEGITDEAQRQKDIAPFVGLRFHDLRHLAITKLAESEASDQTIMSLAGHLDRSMLEHYSHIRAAAKRKAVDAIKSYVQPKNPTRVHPRVHRSIDDADWKLNCFVLLVGAGRFERPTPCAQGRCATRLRYAPTYAPKARRYVLSCISEPF